MSKYNRKKQNPVAAQTDEFVGFWSKAFEQLRPFARGIGWSLVGFVAVVAVGYAATNWMERRAEGATEAFGHAVRIFEADLLTDTSPKLNELEKAHPGSGEDDVPRYKTAKERAEATLAELDKLPAAAAKNARLFRAGVLYDLERFDEARSAYAAAAEGATPEVAAVAHEGVALCLEQAGKLDEALAAYEKVAPRGDKGTEFYRDRALLGIGRLLEKKGDKPKAIEAYKEIIARSATSGTSSLREDAQNRLAELEGK